MTKHVYGAEVSWTLEGELDRGRYSRVHAWHFDGGIDVIASASPKVVPLPYSSEAAVDPEEAFVAAVSSCHMLTFIDIARREGVLLRAYSDKAEGIMEVISAEGEPKRMGITKVVLRPDLTLEGSDKPAPNVLDALHEKAHALCFIANSVKCKIEVEALPVTLSAAENKS